MSAFGITLLWCGLQVTVVGMLTCVVYAACRKIGPSGRSTVALTGLLTVVGLSALAFSRDGRYLASGSWHIPTAYDKRDCAVERPVAVASGNNGADGHYARFILTFMGISKSNALKK
ncbi:MAG: hypothetical protein IH991_23350 [Planctomycetes bacterium]|nr:hypothetical protein [Planctomycetota bacterium]